MTPSTAAASSPAPPAAGSFRAAMSSSQLRKATSDGVSWSAGRASDGRILLDGPVMIAYASGQPMYSATFKAGQKIGEEKYLREDGTPYWTRNHAADGTWTWDNFDATGKRIATSKWRGKTLLSSDVPDPPAGKASPDVPIAPDAE